MGDENEWTHVTIVYDTTSRPYLDGQEVATQSGIPAPTLEDYADRMYLGRPNVDYLRYFNGALDELQLFNEALTTDDVKELYDAY